MGNPKRKKSWAAMSEESTMMMGVYRIDLKAMYSKKKNQLVIKIHSLLSLIKQE